MVGRGFVNSSFVRIQVVFPRKRANFSFNFWPVRVHEKPSFHYVPSTFVAKLCLKKTNYSEKGRGKKALGAGSLQIFFLA